MSEVQVCAVDELPPGEVKIVSAGPDLAIGVYNAGGEFYAIEDRCSHDDGPLAEGEFEEGEYVAVCPRHGARFDIRTGKPLSLPAYIPVDTFEVKVEDEITLYAGEQPYHYTVRATRIVEPDDVSVVGPTSTPILTLLTCYPYMVDTQRFVVIAELTR